MIPFFGVVAGEGRVWCRYLTPITNLPEFSVTILGRSADLPYYLLD
jgi:hypothetical protein